MKIKILPAIFVISLLAIPIGAFIKIERLPGAEYGLIIGLLLQVAFALCCLYEIKQSSKFSKGELLLWGIGLIAASLPVGLIYMLSERKKILINNEKH